MTWMEDKSSRNSSNELLFFWWDEPTVCIVEIIFLKLLTNGTDAAVLAYKLNAEQQLLVFSDMWIVSG